MTHKTFLMIIGVFVTGCNGSVGNNATNMCSASFSGGVTAGSTCQLSAVYAASTGTTSIAFSGMLNGSSAAFDGISFDLVGKPSDGTYDFSRLGDVAGDVMDASSGDSWTIAGGTGASQTVGTLSFMITGESVSAMVSGGELYVIHGSASARLKYGGTRSGVGDVVVTLGY